MKYTVTFVVLLFCSTVFGQKLHVVAQGPESDSSLYHIIKVSDNEFWAGGQFGILVKIDSSGNVSPLNFSNDGVSILKIVKTGDYIFVATENAIIYRYNTIDNTLIKKTFEKFKNRCFYDMIVLKSGSLMVSGGASGISRGKKVIPHGFVATLDQDLNEIKPVWKNIRKFVWAITESEHSEIYAAAFNGINTGIIKSADLNKWKKQERVKGLVHDIESMNNGKIWYSGTRTVDYKKNGVLGVHRQKNMLLTGTGCLWSMNTFQGNVISVTANGELLMVDTDTLGIKPIKTPSNFSIYAVEKISESKILAVGYNRTIYIIDF